MPVEGPAGREPGRTAKVVAYTPAHAPGDFAAGGEARINRGDGVPDFSPEGAVEKHAAGIRTFPVRLVARNPVLPFGAATSGFAEQYRIIRTKIHQHAAKPKLVVISSAGPGDGKTVTAINVAAAMSLKAGV